MARFEHFTPPPALAASERRDWRNNPTGHGFLVGHLPEPTPIAHTAENDHFFLYNPATDRFEVVYQSSYTIVQQLEITEEINRTMPWLPDLRLPRDRHLSFIDKRGNFYNLALLEGLKTEEISNGALHQKHTATFNIAAGDTYEPLTIPIDDIYCLSLAAHPNTWVSMGGDNS